MTDATQTLVSVVLPPRSAPPRPRSASPRRSLTPPTLRVSDPASFKSVHARLCLALRLADTLAELRQHLVDLAADVEAHIETDPDAAPDTLRSVAPEWLEETAPSTPVGSPLAEEFGPGGSMLTAAREDLRRENP